MAVLCDTSGLARVLEVQREALRRHEGRLQSVDAQMCASAEDWEAFRAKILEDVESVRAKVDETEVTVRVMRRDLQLRRATLKLRAFRETRNFSFQQHFFERWKRDMEDQVCLEKRKMTMMSIGRRILYRETLLAFDVWKRVVEVDRAEAKKAQGIGLLAESVVSRWKLRSAFRRWWEENTATRLRQLRRRGQRTLEASFGGSGHLKDTDDDSPVEMLLEEEELEEDHELALRRSDLYEILEKGTAPCARRAAALARAGHHDKAAREMHRGMMVTAKVLATQADFARLQDKEIFEKKFEALRSKVAHTKGELREAETRRFKDEADLSRLIETKIEAACRESELKSEKTMATLLSKAQETQEEGAKVHRKELEACEEAHRHELAKHVHDYKLLEERMREDTKHGICEALEPLRDQVDDAEATAVALSERFAQNERDAKIEAQALRSDLLGASEAVSACLRAAVASLAETQRKSRACQEQQVAAAQKNFRDQVEVFEKTFDDLRSGSAPLRPSPEELAASLFGPYEESAWQARRLPALGFTLAKLAAETARAVADHAAVTANLEEIARVAADFPKQPNTPDVLGPGFGEDEILIRRRAIVDDFLSDLDKACQTQRPRAGALRLEARVRLLRRFDRAIEAALSVYDQVIADAPTLLGRRRALPACVACNRPLPTKVKPEVIAKAKAAAAAAAQAAAAQAAAAPLELNKKRPQSALPLGRFPPGKIKYPDKDTKDQSLKSATNRATSILASMTPAAGPFGHDVLLEDYDEPLLRPATADGHRRFLSEEEEQEHDNRRTDVVKVPLPQPASRGFRAAKRLPGPLHQTQRSGRALP